MSERVPSSLKLAMWTGNVSSIPVPTDRTRNDEDENVPGAQPPGLGEDDLAMLGVADHEAFWPGSDNLEPTEEQGPNLTLFSRPDSHQMEVVVEDEPMSPAVEITREEIIAPPEDSFSTFRARTDTEQDLELGHADSDNKAENEGSRTESAPSVIVVDDDPLFLC